MTPKELSNLLPQATEIIAVGSRVTCNPPVINTDQDFLVFVNNHEMEAALAQLGQLDYCLDGSVVEDTMGVLLGKFHSFSNEENNVNIIMTGDMEFYNLFLQATVLCKYLNLLMKEERVAVFQTILYGVAPAPEYSAVVGDSYINYRATGFDW